MATDYTYEDEKAWRRLSYTWAKAADTKSFALLKPFCTKEVTLIYSALSQDVKNGPVPLDDYINVFFPKFLGDKTLHTQHHLGGAEFALKGDGKASGTFQIWAQHVRDDGGQWAVGNFTTHFYEKVEGEWRFAGIEPGKALWEVGRVGGVFENF